MVGGISQPCCGQEPRDCHPCVRFVGSLATYTILQT